jgi:hypothetical protein
MKQSRRVEDCDQPRSRAGAHGSWLVEKGIDIETVRSLLGHSSIAITQRYIHSTDERRRAAVEKLAPVASEKAQNRANLLHGCDTAEKSEESEPLKKSVSPCFSMN